MAMMHIKHAIGIFVYLVIYVMSSDIQNYIPNAGSNSPTRHIPSLYRHNTVIISSSYRHDV